MEFEEVEGKVLEMGEGEVFWWAPAQRCHVLILNTGENCMRVVRPVTGPV